MIEIELNDIYDLKIIYDNKINNIAEYNLLHVIINPPKYI